MFRRYLLGPIPKSQWCAIAVAGTVAMMAIGWRWTQHRQQTPLAIAPSVVVEIHGEVHHPGTYILESPVTALEALAAAGGCRGGSSSFPLKPIAGERQLRTGQRVRVSCIENRDPQMVIEPMSAAARLALGLRLDLNKANIEDLNLIPGMKPFWAETIVARRNRRLWQQLDDLQEIPGVGPRIVAKWAGFLDLGDEGDPP